MKSSTRTLNQKKTLFLQNQIKNAIKILIDMIRHKKYKFEKMFHITGCGKANAEALSMISHVFSDTHDTQRGDMTAIPSTVDRGNK